MSSTPNNQTNPSQRLDSKLTSKIKSMDSFSHPIHLTYRGQSSIKTLTGGILSIIFGLLILTYFLYRMQMVVSRGDNKLYEVSFIRNLESDGKLVLKDSEFKIIAQMIDREFDNDDNPYIKMRMTMNSNYETKEEEDKFEIPLVKCSGKSLVPDKLLKEWYYGQNYCPEFQDIHFLYSNYFNDVSSWIKFRIDRCNSTQRGLENKSCESRENIDAYLSKTLFSMIQQRSTPNLAISEYTGLSDSDITDTSKMVRKYIDEISYDVVTSHTTVRSMDYNIERNEIYVEDDLFGIIDL